MNPWVPELEVTPSLATQLIESQFPELGKVQLCHFGSGWDNIVYTVNDQWSFRFPQRQAAVAGVKLEMSVLPILAQWIREIPRIQYLGKPCDLYPWPFFGYRPVPGIEPSNVDLPNRSELARSMGRFLKTLHGEYIFSELKLHTSADPYGRLDFSQRVPKTEERLANLRALELPENKLRQILRDALDTPTLPCRSLVHGDLHFRHIMTSAQGDFQGVIDWGDLHLNDPAIDLQLYWSFFSAKERELFLEAYGFMNDIQKIQSRSFAVFLNVAILTAAQDQKQDLIAREALRSLKRTLID